MSADQQRFVARVTVPGRIESVRGAAAFLVETARSLHVPVAADRIFEVAIVEALNNALKHNVRDGDSSLHCEIELDGRRLSIRVLDEGARAPVALALPAGAVPPWGDGVIPEALPESGYGLYLIRAVFPQLRAVTRDGHHGVEMELSF
jgi:anti-sigma regulatory factor (Ser/Thr protein kinase)